MNIGRENPRESEGTNGVASPRQCPTWQMKVILTVLLYLVLYSSASFKMSLLYALPVSAQRFTYEHNDLSLKPRRKIIILICFKVLIMFWECVLVS